MKHKVVVPGHNMGRNSADKENSPVSGGKCNQCVIYPPNVLMVAEALGRRNQNCIVRTKVASDLIIQLGDFSFHLHKLPMVSRSAYLNRLIFQKRSNGSQNEHDSLHIQIDNFPGGFETFELVVKFCYGWKVDMTASNVAPLYSAAHFLEMSDDLEQGNLISKTEAFLSFLLFSSWTDTFQILRSCEPISPWAKKLQILKRCADAISWKASTNPEAIRLGHDDAQCLIALLGNTNSELGGDKVDNWWFEDVSYLRIDHFIVVVESIKKRGMKPEVVGACIAHWTARWVLRISFRVDNLTPKHLSVQLQRVTTECVIKVLPSEKNSVSCNFLLHLLKVGLVMKVDRELLDMVERRAASMVEQCRVIDILVKNYGDDETSYDVKVVNRVLRSYASSDASDNASGLFAVGKLLDGYLILVAGDEKLSIENFRALVEALPKRARQSHDGLYRAIDMYLKAHPSLTEEERQSVCKAIENHKLSKEATEHATHNDRLPLNITTRLVLMEQVNMGRSMTENGSSFRRKMAQTVIRSVSKGLGGWMDPHSEINKMKREVETMKMQLSELKMCKSKLQRQARSFVR